MTENPGFDSRQQEEILLRSEDHTSSYPTDTEGNFFGSKTIKAYLITHFDPVSRWRMHGSTPPLSICLHIVVLN
jgi:hypothetical protein